MVKFERSFFEIGNEKRFYSMVLFSTALDAAKNKKKRMKDVTFGRKIKLKIIFILGLLLAQKTQRNVKVNYRY